MKRGDVLLARFPHPSGGRGKKRPVVVVQADVYNQTLRTIVVAEVTKNLQLANDPACLMIDASTTDGKRAGVVQDSVISCLMLATLKVDLVDQVIGELSDSLKLKLNDSEGSNVNFMILNHITLMQEHPCRAGLFSGSRTP